MLQIACGSEGLWVELATAFGIDPQAPGHGHEPRAGRQPRGGDRRRQRRVRRPHPGRGCSPAWTRSGVPAGKVRTLDRGLRLGPDAARRACARRRPPGARRRRAARAADAVFDDNAFDGEAETTGAPRPPGARRAQRLRAGLARRRRTAGGGDVDGRDDSPDRLGDARTLRRHRPGRGQLDGRGTRPRCSPPPRTARMPRELAAAAEKAGTDESIDHRRGHHPRAAGGAGRRGVRLPGRLDRQCRRRAAVLAVERAMREGLPLLAAPVSGGTRMQEGTVAFLADDRHHRRHRPAQGGRACPTSSTCATPRSAGCSRPGARWAT